MFFKKRQPVETYDKDTLTPVLKCSICNGEQVAGFRNKHTGEFKDIMLIRSAGDLQKFKEQYGITGELEKIY